MKVKKLNGQTIPDILIQTASLEYVYEFLQQEEIDYIDKDVLTEAYYTINDDWRNGNSQWLIDNEYTVVSRDDEAYYPPSAYKNIFDNQKIENIVLSKSGTTYYFKANTKNYGYLSTGATWEYTVTDLDTDTVITSGTLYGDAVGYLGTTTLDTVSASLTQQDIYEIKYFQRHFDGYEKSIYKKEIRLR